MTKIRLLLIPCIFLYSFMLMPTKSAYQLFDFDGSVQPYDSLLQATQNADIVLFGELHNDPICHWLQYELTRDILSHKKQQAVLGAEMFEADNQVLLEEYFAGIISEKKFEEEARLWPNYKTDYKRLVLLAKDRGIPFIATNIPRRYANTMYKQGEKALEACSPQAKQWMAPLPLEVDLSLPSYQSMLNMMGGHEAGPDAANFPKAQAIKDATMAKFILENWQAGKTFIHYNGAFHSNNREGIVWYLQKANPDLNIVTISTVLQADVTTLTDDYKGIADFVIVVNENMTNTH